jgi:hypothetical protein
LLPLIFLTLTRCDCLKKEQQDKHHRNWILFAARSAMVNLKVAGENLLEIGEEVAYEMSVRQ